MSTKKTNEFNGLTHKKNSFLVLEESLNNSFLPLTILVFFTLIIYYNSFNVPFIMDDIEQIQNNYAIRNLFDFSTMWNYYSGRIVAYFSFALNYFISGENIISYHVLNLIIHIFNGFMFFLILKQILSLEYFKEKSFNKFRNIVCLLSSLLFIVHPINTSAVTYMVQRIASLATLFMMLSIFSYLKFRISGKNRYFILTLVFIILAMFTKENTIILPILILLIELLLLYKSIPINKVKRIFVFILLLLTILIIPATSFLGGHSQSDPNKTFKATTSMNRLEYLTTQINVVSRYSELMLIPDRQNFDYEDQFPKSDNIFVNNTLFSFFFLLLILIAAFLCIRRNKLISLGIFWYFIGLSVESSLISIKDVYFEHRLYFSSAGFVIFLIGLIYSTLTLFNKKISMERPMIFFMTICIFMVPLYSGLTIKRNYLLSDNIRLWTDIVYKTPASSRAHANLAHSYLYEYEYKGNKNPKYLIIAETELKKSLKLNSKNDLARLNLARTYCLQERYRESIKQAKEVLVYYKDIYVYHYLGLSYELSGNTKKALNEYLKGHNLNKKSPVILFDLARIYQKLNDITKYFYYSDELKKYNK